MISFIFSNPHYTVEQQPFYGHCTSQPALADTHTQELEDFTETKFYCPRVS